MVKVKINLILFALLFTICGCSDEDDFQEDDRNEMIKISEQSVVSTELVAENLINAIKDNPMIAKEINNAVKTIVDYGLDENLTFYDILNTSNSVFFNSDNVFINLKRSIDREILSNLGLNATNYYKNLNIYWGYHDSWDGTTLPIICYLTDNDDSTTTILNGFQVVNGNIRKVTVTDAEFDSETYPIIIVNFNEDKYSEYPNFKNGIRTKDEVAWLEPISKHETPKIKGWYDDPSKIYSVEFHALKSGGKQHDSWISGGSEFQLISICALDNTSGLYYKRRCYFTRRQIRKKTTKYFKDKTINSDWKPEFQNMGLRLYELDGNGGSSFSFSLKIKDYANISMTIPIANSDDNLDEVNLSRDYSFARYTIGKKSYGFDDCIVYTEVEILNR